MSLHNNLPEELRDRNQWIIVRITPDPQNPVKTKKEPVNLTGEYLLSGYTKKQFTFNECVEALEHLPPKGDITFGLGYVFMGECVGIDVDNNDPEPLAHFKSYSEKSISGKGYHIICHGKKPGGDCKVGPYEMYETGRFFLCTGDYIESSPFVEERQDSINWFYEKYIQKDPREEAYVLPESISMGERNDALMRYAASLRSAGTGMDHDDILTHLRMVNRKNCRKPLSDKELRSITRSICRYPKGQNIKTLWETSPNSKSLPGNFKNIKLCLELDPKLKDMYKFNQFSEKIVYTQAPPWGEVVDKNQELNDYDLLSMKNYLIQEYNIDARKDILKDTIVQYSLEHAFHPVKEFLEGVVWDGIPRLDTWLSVYAGAENTPLTRHIGKLTLVAAVNRIYEPGVKYDHVLILEGRQGLGKSFLTSILGLNHLGHNWADTINVISHNRDVIDKLQGKWIIEIDEFGAMKKQEVEIVKSFITLQCDRARLAYRTSTEDFKRKCVFIATINAPMEGYLQDTENRRFLPVEVGIIDLDKLKNDISQIWAEAYSVYKKGFPLWLNDELLAGMASEEQRKRMTQDPWENTIYSYILEKSKFDDTYKVNFEELFVDCLGNEIGKATLQDHRRIAKIMSKVGAERKSIRVRTSSGEKICKGYVTCNLRVEKQMGYKDDFVADIPF